MFTFKPSSKTTSNGNGNNGNGNGNGHSNGNGNGNGHSATNGNGNGNGNGNKNGGVLAPVSGWLRLGIGPKNGNGNGNGEGRGHGDSRGHTNGNGHSNKIESVLGPGISFQGHLTGTGGVRIEGAFDGSITVKGPVVIADGARVTADIQAISVSVGGSVQGNITAKKVEIRSTGRIFGDLVTTSFATEEGAFLRGQVRMEDDVTAPAQLAAPPAALPEPVMIPEPAAEVAA